MNLVTLFLTYKLCPILRILHHHFKTQSLKTKKKLNGYNCCYTWRMTNYIKG